VLLLLIKQDELVLVTEANDEMVYKNIKPTLSELNYKGVGVDVNSYLLDLLPNKKQVT